MRIAVIGAGWAGLAAAVRLVETGKQVTLIEAGRVPGGRARTVTLDGRALDNGQHILLGAYRETLALMRRVGADPEQLFTRKPLAVIDPSGFQLCLPKLPAPLNLAWALLTARRLSFSEKLTAALWMQKVKWQRFKLPAEQASRYTVANWLDAAGQQGQLRRHLWEPLCLAALNTPAERASAQLFANVLRDSLGSPRRADTDLLLPRVPFGQLLPEPAIHWLLAQGASVRMGQRVQQIQASDTGVNIDGEIFDAAVLAVAPHHLGKLWPQAPQPEAYEPIATIYLQYPSHAQLAFPLLNMNGPTGQWLVDRGDGLLACVLSGHGDWEKLSDTELVAQLLAELQQIPSLRGLSPTWQKRICEKRATFTASPDLQRCPAAPHPRVAIAGDHTWADYPATLEGAVRSGLRAAALLQGG